MLNKKQLQIARAIDMVRRDSIAPGYQQAITAVAHAIANEICTGGERLHFLITALGNPKSLDWGK